MDRWVEELEDKCLKDINFEPITIFTSEQIHERLHAALNADSRFLERLQIMDYSLMLSIQFLSKDMHWDIPPKRYSTLMGGLEATAYWDTVGMDVWEACIVHVGFIDTLTTYNIKKLVAHAVKSSTIGHFYDIDTEPPDVYAERFCGYFKRKILAETENVKANMKSPKSTHVHSTAPSDLVMCDATLVPLAPVSLCPVPSPHPATTCTGGDLIDFDAMGDTTCKKSPRVVEPTCFDLLCFDCDPAEASRPTPTQVVPEHVAVNFDLLA